MNIETIVADWLKANNYDGLHNSDAGCGCSLRGLMNCQGLFIECPMGSDCEPGYLGPDPSGECDYLIYGNKKAAEAARIEESNG